MAKKSTTETIETKVEETVTPVEVATEQVTKPRTVIAKSPTAFRKTTSLEVKQIVGQMPMGVAYVIVKEVNSKIYGDFYKLENGYYITKNGDYVINN